MLKQTSPLPSRPCPPRHNFFATASATETIVRYIITRSDVLPHRHTSPPPRRVNVIPLHRQSRHFTSVLNGCRRAVVPALLAQGFAPVGARVFRTKKRRLSRAPEGFSRRACDTDKEFGSDTNTHAMVCIGNRRGIGKEVDVKTSLVMPVFDGFFLRPGAGRFYTGEALCEGGADGSREASHREEDVRLRPAGYPHHITPNELGWSRGVA